MKSSFYNFPPLACMHNKHYCACEIFGQLTSSQINGGLFLVVAAMVLDVMACVNTPRRKCTCYIVSIHLYYSCEKTMAYKGMWMNNHARWCRGMTEQTVDFGAGVCVPPPPE